jgi:hypothetical protein
MNAKLSEERTVFKIVVPVRVERICIRPDLDVPPDFGFGRVHQPQPNGFPRRRPFACVRRKLPGTPSLPMPVAPAFHTGSLECPCVPCVQQNTRLRAFWPEPVSIFGSLGLTMLMAVHLCWAFHPACPSDRIDARSLGNHLTAFSASQGCQDFVPAASDKTVTSFASAGRLLRTESQVWFMLFMSYQTITVTPSFHTQALPLIEISFLCPQSGRGQYAQCPRDNPGRRMRPRPVRVRVQPAVSA